MKGGGGSLALSTASGRAVPIQPAARTPAASVAVRPKDARSQSRWSPE